MESQHHNVHMGLPSNTHTHCVHDCTSRSRGGAQGADSDGTTEGSIARRGVDETAMHCGTEEHRVESIQAGQREEWHSESLAKKEVKRQKECGMQQQSQQAPLRKGWAEARTQTLQVE